ncbi:MAG: hypothetical protein CM15mP74_32140 [Halieaceae bacterium]|nr:MAG: hypothetical protein CM15mP74_32140 [Halieaceae bacterium]
MNISDADGTHSALSGGAGTPHSSAQRATQAAMRVSSPRRWHWVSTVLVDPARHLGVCCETSQSPAIHLLRRYPRVGGGRDIPYTRYDNLSLHDQGAETWFVDEDGRNLVCDCLTSIGPSTTTTATLPATRW